jgi:DnaJ-class molecular chaperone|uniref:J domain-containing protein n=1 Tax=viral metagenome TaxID=1070528 RepID=A0A6C0CBI0_9ZZZZ
MNDYDDYFSILNLSNKASLQDIKKAYRILSIKYHPDKNHNANPELFNKVNEAYVKLTTNFASIQNAILNQSMAVQNTNNSLNTGPHNGSNTGPHNGSNNSLNNGLNYSYSHQLTSITNYEDIIITLNISYYDSYNGSSKPITIERKLFTNNVISHELETLYVPITKGIDSNEILLLHNKGNIYITNGTTSYSNVKIVLILSKHECFERIGLDIIYTKPITLKEALTGFTFTLLHLNKKHYKIVSNEIIDFNYVKIVNNLGFIRDAYVGNLIIKFTITFPKSISQTNKTMLENLL